MEENKSKSLPKDKERRQNFNQEGMPKRSNKTGLLKKNLSQLPPPPPLPPLDGGSPVKKILSEANKIVKIGMQKDHALLERDRTLQSSNETIDNLRKNILHLQMEYEKLDQNYQREVSYRSELVKRMDATREMIESVTQSSNVLSKSLKELEADKFKLAEFYESINQNQKEVEEKHSEVEKIIREQDELLKANIENRKKSQDKILSQHSETVSQLNEKFNQANERLRVVANENEKLEKRIQEYQESYQKLEACLDQQQKLNCRHEANVAEFKYSLKKLKIQRFKYQKMWRHKKMQISVFLRKYKTLKKTLKKAKQLQLQCCSVNQTLKSKNSEWEEKFEKHLEEYQLKLLSWQSERNELNEKVLGKKAEVENLKAENENLRGKLSESTKYEKSKQADLNQVQEELSKMLSENLKLKDEVVRLSEENDHKSEIISDLQRKANSTNVDFNSKIESYKKESEKLQELVNKLESQLSDAQKSLAEEKKQKESAIFDFDSKLEENSNMSIQKITDLEKLLEEKTVCIQKLEFERNKTGLDNLKSLEKLTKQLEIEKSKNQELSRNFKSLNESHEDVNKQLENAKKQISEFQQKLADVGSLNKALKSAQIDLETTTDDLKKEIELRKKSFEALEKKHKKTEEELSKMGKISEENASLKSSVADFENQLEATEARLEAYKMVVKKLERLKKVEAKDIHSEEVSRFKSELARLEEASKTGKDSSELPVGTPKKTPEETNKRGSEVCVAASKEKGDSSSQKLNTKENEAEITEIESWHEISTPPLQGNKKFLSIPRKIYTSTPRSGFRSPTPSQRRDPYEFDSDSSVERFDQDKVLKVHNRQKKETNKKSKKKLKTSV